MAINFNSTLIVILTVITTLVGMAGIIICAYNLGILAKGIWKLVKGTKCAGGWSFGYFENFLNNSKED